jgi:serine/threonine-protein kinase
MWNARMARRQVTTFEKCKHPAVVPFVDVGTAGAMHYLAWPFVEGESFQSVVQREGRLEPNRMADYALQIAEGLAVCHQNGLIHGMLKPSNLLVGSDQKIRILDYGVGALLSQGDSESLIDTRSTANVLAAGLDCVAPECIMDPSKQSGAADQYSLGCVLYFCLAGRLPFEGSASEKLQAHQTKQPDPIRDINPDVPEKLADVVDRLMQKAPAARYADIKELIAALSPVVAPEVPTTTPASNGGPSHLAPSLSGLHQVAGGGENGPSVAPATQGTMISRPAPTLSGTHQIPVARESTPTVPLIPVLVEPKQESVPKLSDRPAMPPEVAPSSPAPSPSGIHPEPRSREPMPAAEPPAPKIVPPPPPKESGLTALPPGATQVLGKVTRRAPSEYSVFDMPALDFPHDIPQPARPQEIKPKPSMPKLQAPVSPEGLVPINEEIAAEKVEAAPEQRHLRTPQLKESEPADVQPVDAQPAESQPADTQPVNFQPADAQPAAVQAAEVQPTASQPADAQLSLEERLGPTGMLILGIFVVAVVFLLGYLLFKP